MKKNSKKQNENLIFNIALVYIQKKCYIIGKFTTTISNRRFVVIMNCIEYKIILIL